MIAVCIDSNADVVADAVAKWRDANTYPLLLTNGFSLRRLKESMSNRDYLEQELLLTDVTYLSGSGHGLDDEFQGSDNLPALKVGQYKKVEVTGRVVHLLSCRTALLLGRDLVKNGCIAFFGYDMPFSFYYEFIDQFMSPNKLIDEMISQGHTAQSVHEAVVVEYERIINSLKTSGASVVVIADMETNLNHFCSPSKDAKWGNPMARITRQPIV